MAPRRPTAEGLRITEARNPRTRDLDRLSSSDLLRTLLEEDRGVAAAVCATLPSLELACDALVEVLSAGGRWFNVGAGTSGRIGALDAAEIPPTFGLERDRVQALIAGGERALLNAVEGAEDDRGAAERDLERGRLGAGDAVVVLSASGTTPYAVAACAYARQLGAVAIGVTCVGGSELATTASIPIVAEVGPEAIAGSTRMKGGLAQKMILHTLSTATMVRLGRVRGNLMTGVRAVNDKLRARALRILMELSGSSVDAARLALSESDGSVEHALALLGDPPRD